MWAAVSSRLHRPLRIFPFGRDADEVMLYGSVHYTLKDGREADVSFLFFFLSKRFRDRAKGNR